MTAKHYRNDCDFGETAESRQDEARLPQLHDELKVIQARLDELTADLDALS